MPQTAATVRVRQVTTTNRTTASVLIVNTGYLKTLPGLLKLFIVILSLVTLILVLSESHSYVHYLGRSAGFYASDLFLLLASFLVLVTTGLMLLSALFSLNTASLLPKIAFDSVYHFTCFVLMIIGGTWVLVRLGNTGTDLKQHTKIVTASVIALIIGLLHLIHGIVSYRSTLH